VALAVVRSLGSARSRRLGQGEEDPEQDLIDQYRPVDEVQATAGDLRRICDFFGVTMATAEHYASVLHRPGLAEFDTVP